MLAAMGSLAFSALVPSISTAFSLLGPVGSVLGPAAFSVTKSAISLLPSQANLEYSTTGPSTTSTTTFNTTNTPTFCFVAFFLTVLAVIWVQHREHSQTSRYQHEQQQYQHQQQLFWAWLLAQQQQQLNFNARPQSFAALAPQQQHQLRQSFVKEQRLTNPRFRLIEAELGPSSYEGYGTL